ncbi:short-chain dehydrogenase/reductase [Amycolatopsis sp. FDAARGOS 1241]|uniref:short-chain dehydrogenase/reductase n=1 Tax=Amycolatopsis sp. FDAARGOS 1241 TaxID=2778070 RepID=UPI0019520F35|nr:short-chain dehydrogenase/reductase [Amycolatopsis sp. FDAARGOS 1241]QRP49126.1 SDR family oxidoreductase [Amycolatopsis sp. FDAARGOS 1241]
MDLNLVGKRALVTGASKGIGAAIAEVLAGEGCHLHLAARSEDALQDLAKKLRDAHGVEVTVHAVDLRVPEDLERLAAATADAGILVNNAGDIPAGTLHQVDRDRWRHAWDLKVYAYVDLSRLFFARLGERGSGVIVNVIGAAGERPTAGYIAGGAGNAALMAFTKALGGDGPRRGVRVVGVNPGPVATERITAMRAANADVDASFAALPSGRVAEAREVADLVAFLASPRAAYISGTIVTIDGGISAAG